MSIFRPVKEPEEKIRSGFDTVVRHPAAAPPPPRAVAPVRAAAAPAVAAPRLVAAPQAGAAADPRAPAPAAVRIPATAVGVRKPAAPAPSGEAASLVAGPGVTLKGSMQCDMLRVEGAIEGDLRARKLAIAPGGTFVGTAEIEAAEVEGHFEGTLVVSGLLVVRSTGRLSGKFQYGEIEVERGGGVSGEVLLVGKSKSAEDPKPAAAVPQ